ncbi:MAG: hypothetical protein J07HQX50_02582 [Haloquadratum sp. J07HQX50]|nr:MAG: hypothetical protein J07HQX50_02582 [Haloquadratum sp. J07HQX50]
MSGWFGTILVRISKLKRQSGRRKRDFAFVLSSPISGILKKSAWLILTEERSPALTIKSTSGFHRTPNEFTTSRAVGQLYTRQIKYRGGRSFLIRLSESVGAPYDYSPSVRPRQADAHHLSTPESETPRSTTYRHSKSKLFVVSHQTSIPSEYRTFRIAVWSEEKLIHT